MTTVGLLRWSGTTKDARGNTVDVFGEPEEFDCVVAAKITATDGESGRAGYDNRVVDSLTLLDVPIKISHKDRVRVEGDTYRVEGIPFAWDRFDPFGPPLGRGQVSLKMVTA